MKIKRLELAGFKSFLDKTRFEFDVPITSVVGPNGCGKSNIVDALKWVTGELSYKQLRGRNSEDLIFAGSDRRPPTSMMEVAITLDNELRTAPPQYNEYAEITVLRRIFRDGTSEFFINKTPCRLRDIVDLFLDTGIGQISYSIIEQGKIGAIVSSRAEDRRLMIEEAAGITKFKNRKKAAERKMEYTKQNLLRVNDVTSELKKQISSLERQAKKAEKYHGYKTEYENLDISIAGSEYLQIQEDVKKLKGLETQLQDSLTECSSILSDTQARHEAEKENLSEVEESFQQSQQRLFQKKSEIQDSSNKKDNVRAEIDRTATLLEESVIKVQSLEAKISEYEDKTQTIQKELSDLEETRTGFQARFESKNKELEVHTQSLSAKQDTLDKVKQQDLEIYKEQTQIKSSIESKKSRIEELEREVQKYNQNFQQLREELQDKESKHLDYKKSLEEISQLCFSFEENQKAIRSSIELLNEKKNQLHQDIMSCEKEINEYQTRLEALQEFSSTYQGYAKGVQDIMAKKEQGEQGFASVVGVLGHLIKPEKGYQKAVQAALDKLVECIVVDSHSDTGRYIDFLEEKGGRGVFLSK
ncbi:MAG: AAA family ATPase, partial [Bdellovibrionales bacterium]|nr:AAA family ATPase [Bdellovibrionales bacterium]